MTERGTAAGAAVPGTVASSDVDGRALALGLLAHLALDLHLVVHAEGQGPVGDRAEHGLLDLAVHDPREGHLAVLDHDPNRRVHEGRVAFEETVAVDPAVELSA